MTKLLILFLVVVLIVILLVSFILRSLRRIISPFFNHPAKGSSGVNEPQKREGEVLYKKDDVVVLKGEAERKKKE